MTQVSLLTKFICKIFISINIHLKEFSLRGVFISRNHLSENLIRPKFYLPESLFLRNFIYSKVFCPKVLFVRNFIYSKIFCPKVYLFEILFIRKSSTRKSSAKKFISPKLHLYKTLFVRNSISPKVIFSKFYLPINLIHRNSINEKFYFSQILFARMIPISSAIWISRRSRAPSTLFYRPNYNKCYIASKLYRIIVTYQNYYSVTFCYFIFWKLQ